MASGWVGSRSRIIVTTALVAGAAALMLVGASAALDQSRPALRTIYVETASYKRSVAELTSAADAIAVVRYSGQSSVHWNSSDNQEWVSDSSARQAYIYRDDGFAVVRVLKGSLGESVVIRGIGGQIGDVKQEYEGQPQWTPDGDYLVFLRLEDAPTREGSEEAWTVLGMEQGTFEGGSSGRWTNPATELHVGEADLTQ